MMDFRKKLVMLLIQDNDLCKQGDCEECGANGECNYYRTADRLIAHGVTIQEWYPANVYPKEDGIYIVQTSKGTITTARFYTFKQFPATRSAPTVHRSARWQSNLILVKWTFLPKPPESVLKEDNEG